MVTALLIVGAVLLLFGLAGCLIVWTFGWGDEPDEVSEERPARDTPRPRHSDGA